MQRVNTETNPLIESMLHEIMEQLPHGSGIDADWTAEILKNGKFRFYNSYHCMNENGFYDGWVDFCLTIDPFTKHPERDFRLSFLGSFSQYKAQRHYIRDYLEQTFYDGLQEIFAGHVDPIHPLRVNLHYGVNQEA